MDKNVIAQIKQKYDLTKDDDILALYAALQAGVYDLDFPQGRVFDDEVYELAMQVKKKRRAQGGQTRSSSSKGRQSEGAQRKGSHSAGGRNSQAKNAKVKKNKKVVVLTKRELHIRRVLTVTLSLLAIGCLGYFGLYSYEAYQLQQKNKRLAALKENASISAMYGEQTVTQMDEETGQEIVLTVLDEYKSLYNQNKNLIGWLKIADTNIDYPVMQTADNTFYLDHDVNLNEDKNGTLFMDSGCDILKPSTNFIIYGHNMRSGNMFGNLDKYKAESYYKKHQTIEFDTIYEHGTYQVMYAFTSHIYTEDEITFKYYQFIDAASQAEFDSNMRTMQEMSLYDTGIEAAYGDQLITLSTCDYEEEDGRFVVVAKRIN